MVVFPEEYKVEVSLQRLVVLVMVTVGPEECTDLKLVE